ncbi:MAG: hypothetical protein HYY61_01245, partial [Deltaproteobacteria bacterium]|nr:hypothetical protein [Deltaproteobacteria bacterium]
MKYLKLLVITMVTVSLSLVGCSGKKGSEDAVSPEQKQSEVEESNQDTLGASQQEDSQPQGEADSSETGAITSAMEEIKNVPTDEKIRRLNLNLAALVGGAIFLEASFPIEWYAQRAVVYYSSLMPIVSAGKDTIKVPQVGMWVDPVKEAGYRTYLQEFQTSISALKKIYPDMTTQEAAERLKKTRARLFKKYVASHKGLTKREATERLAQLEKKIAADFQKIQVKSRISHVAVYGAKGMRYFGALVGIWGFADMLFTTTEMGDGEISAEDRLTDFERAVYNY